MTKDILERLELRYTEAKTSLADPNPTKSALHLRLHNLTFVTNIFLEVVKSISEPDKAFATYPTQLGAYMDVGTVVAFGYFTDAELSIFLLLDKANRTPGQENYELRVWNSLTDEVNNVQRFANLVVATEVWQNEYGMDI